MSFHVIPSVSAILAATLLLTACQEAATTNTPDGQQPVVQLSPAAAVGKLMFSDTALSASGQQSCATCHDASHGFTANDGLPVPLGGVHMNLQGLRNTPTIMYASYTPPFTLAGLPDGPGQPGQPAGTPTGGFFRDGRVNTLAEQAVMPFLGEFEMANANAAEVVTRLQGRPYLAQFTAVYGASILNDPDATLVAMGRAIAAFETEDPVFHPFSSKYDSFTRGQARLSTQELNGMRLFNDPNKGNCAACHVSTGVGGVPALFTDHTYDNVGVPRNWAIAFNNDNTTLPDYITANGATLGAPNHRYFDLGLCGPTRSDLANDPTQCGRFKVPTLRNIALKQHYFHNGVFDNLNDVVNWYVTRDLNPTHWYTTVDGRTPDKQYNDLPQQYDGNVNREEVPYNVEGGQHMNTAEMKDLIVFLCTLTDGYDAKNPSAYPYPDQCRAAQR